MARVEKPRGSGRGRGCVSLTERCYTGVAAAPAARDRHPRDAVLAGPFRGVHRAIGADDQLVRGPTVDRVADDADRQRRPVVGARQVHRHRIDPDPDLLGEHEAAGRIGLGQEHDELVAAVARGGIDLAHAPADHLADRPQDAVAVEVSEPVVDRLELVEIHHQQAEPASGPGAPGDLAVHRREEERAVEQAGQRIDGRQPDRGIAGPALGTGDDHRRRTTAGSGRSG